MRGSTLSGLWVDCIVLDSIRLCRWLMRDGVHAEFKVGGMEGECGYG